MVEYAHLVVRLDLRDAMAEVKGACQNIRQTAEHCRQHSEGMDIDELMLRQDDLCETYLRQLQNQVYALGSEVIVRGMYTFTAHQGKRQYEKLKGADESYAELVKRVKEEGMDGFLKKLGVPLSMKDDIGDRFCGFHDIVSEERSDHLYARCQAWWLPEMSAKMPELRYTPEAVKIFEHFGDTQDVYYLRRNVERFMTMRPITWRQYLRGRGKPRTFWKVYQKQDTWRKPKLPEKKGAKSGVSGEKKVQDKEDTMLESGVRRTNTCLLYTSPSPRDKRQSRMPSSA